MGYLVPGLGDLWGQASPEQRVHPTGPSSDLLELTMIEPSLIGGIIRFPKTITTLGLKPEHFVDEFCMRAYAAMTMTLMEGRPINPIDIARGMGGDAMTNLTTLKEWRDQVPSAAVLDGWAERLKKDFRTRTVKQILLDAAKSTEDGDAIRAKVIMQMASIEDEGRSYETGGKEWMTQVVEKVEQVWDAKHNGNGIVGIRTGNATMDHMLGGFHKSDLIIMGARPKIGKTAWLMNCAKAAALDGKRVGIASAEMPAWQLGERIVSDVANLNADAFRSGNFDEHGFSALTYGTQRVAELPIRLFDKPRMTPGDIAIQAKAWELSGGVDIIFVDYLTRLIPDQTDRNRTREVGRMVSDLKTLARTMNIPVVCLAQLSRDVESRADKRPMPSDLRDSGEIEQEADVIMFLYREGVYNKDADPRLGEIIVSANRHGPSGRIRCSFDGQFMRWADAESVDPLDAVA